MNNIVIRRNVSRSEILFRYLFVFALIVISADNYLFSGNGGEIYNTIRYFFTGGVSLLMFFRKRNNKNTRLFEKVVAVVVFLLILSSIFSEGKISGGASLVAMLIIAAYFVTSYFSIDDFFDVFSKIILYGTLYSVIIWVLAFFLHVLPMQDSITLGGAYAKSFGFCYFIRERNTFLFREPGMFQVYINLAFLMMILRNKGDIKFSHMAVFAAGVLSTYSTAGFICFFLIMILQLILKRGSGGKMFWSVIIIALTAAVMTSSLYQELVFSKLSSVNEEGSSMMSRSAAIIVSLSIAFHNIPNILFGVGISGIEKYFPIFSNDIFGVPLNINGNSTNTFFIPAAIFGVWFMIFYFVGYYKFARRVASPWRKTGVLVLLILFLLFSNEGMYYSIIPYILVLYGLNSKTIFNTVE